MLKKVLIAGSIILAVVVIGILAMAAGKPDQFACQRSIVINAPREKVFEQINNYKNWTNWSPYEKKDPNMKRTYSGPESGVGAKYGWSGNDEVGVGGMEIKESKPPTKIAFNLHFDKPFEGDNLVVFSMVPHGENTEVTWAMSGENPFMCKVMSIFFDMDKMCGDDFDKGLSAMKAYIEKNQAAPEAKEDPAKADSK